MPMYLWLPTESAAFHSPYIQRIRIDHFAQPQHKGGHLARAELGSSSDLMRCLINVRSSPSSLTAHRFVQCRSSICLKFIKVAPRQLLFKTVNIQQLANFTAWFANEATSPKRCDLHFL